jgi:hypothetical protein
MGWWEISFIVMLYHLILGENKSWTFIGFYLQIDLLNKFPHKEKIQLWKTGKDCRNSHLLWKVIFALMLELWLLETIFISFWLICT